MKKNILIVALLAMSAGVQAKGTAALSSGEKQNLELAVQRGNWDPGVKNIITKNNINVPITGAEWSTFLYAANQGQTQIMSGLYNISKSCVKKTTPAGGTALMEAARSGQLKSMKWFDSNGLLSTYLNKKDSLGNTPLTQAIIFNQTVAAKWLLEKGAKIDKRSKEAASSSDSILFLLKKYEKKAKKKKEAKK